MSKSYRKTPCFKVASNISNKEDKRQANRAFRRVNKALLNIGEEPDKLIREVSNVWCFCSDGLARYHSWMNNSKYMRK